jgi:prevent-host-death family protein
MRLISARDAARSFGAMLDELRSKGPVTILRHGRKTAVMMDAERFEEYRKAYESAEECRMIEALEHCVNELAEGRLGRGERAHALAKRIRDGDDRERS